MARFVATKSKDKSTKCGCVLVRNKAVISSGYNGLCSGMKYTGKEEERPYKYLVMEHAERNSVFLAAKNGNATGGCIAYITGPPCCDCARALVQAGICQVIVPVKHNFIERINDKQWKDSCSAARDILRECGVEYLEIDIDG
jgi:dCMP deaminase